MMSRCRCHGRAASAAPRLAHDAAHLVAMQPCNMRRHVPQQHASPRHAAVVVSGGHLQTCRALASSTTEHAAAPPGALSSSGGGQTVKKLILLRHAESESTAGVRDHDRSISELGKLEAASIAAELKARGWVPDLVLASNSKRTKQTLDEMAEVISELGEVDGHFYGSLYTVAALDGQTKQHMSECLLEVVDDAKNSCVMCVGHNKGWEEAASAFTGKAIKLRTASAALLQCVTSSWREALAESANWTLVEVCSPAHATSS